MLWSFGHVEKKAKVGNFDSYNVTNLGQTVTLNILTDISRINDKQAMKFCQFIEHNKKKIFFLKIHEQNVMCKLVLEPFFKKSKLIISLDEESEML